MQKRPRVYSPIQTKVGAPSEGKMVMVMLCPDYSSNHVAPWESANHVLSLSIHRTVEHGIPDLSRCNCLSGNGIQHRVSSSLAGSVTRAAIEQEAMMGLVIRRCLLCIYKGWAAMTSHQIYYSCPCFSASASSSSLPLWSRLLALFFAFLDIIHLVFWSAWLQLYLRLHTDTPCTYWINIPSIWRHLFASYRKRCCPVYSALISAFISLFFSRIRCIDAQRVIWMWSGDKHIPVAISCVFLFLLTVSRYITPFISVQREDWRMGANFSMI